MYLFRTVLITFFAFLCCALTLDALISFNLYKANFNRHRTEISGSGLKEKLLLADILNAEPTGYILKKNNQVKN